MITLSQAECGNIIGRKHHHQSVKRQFDIEWQRSNRANTTDSRRDDAEPTAGPSTESSNLESDFDLDDLFTDDVFNAHGIGNMADIQNNLPAMPTATQVAQGGGQTEPMDTTGLGSTGGGTGANAIATTTNAEGLAMIMPNPSLKKIYINFAKKWYQYTYGYAHTTLEGTNLTRVLTPYAYYPVDWVPWYISPQEYMSLPFNAKIVKVSDIHFLGTRTAFDHGTTLSGTATTEYVHIIKWCVGLNNKIYLDNRPIISASTEPMKPTGVKNKTLAEQWASMYDIAGSHEIPRHLNWYAGIIYNKQDGEYDGIPTIQSYRMDKLLKTGLANKCMNQCLINYSYELSNGYLKPTKNVLLPMYNKNDGFSDDITNKNVLYKHMIPHTLKLTADTVNKGTVHASSTLEKTHYNYVNRNTHNYYQSVEGYTFVHVHSGEHSSFRNQPQVHLGLLATPSLKPAKESVDFLNSSAYTVSYTHCDVEFDMESMCTSGDPYDWPEDVKFFIDKARGFQGYGAHVFGISATTDGRLENIYDISGFRHESGRLIKKFPSHLKNIGFKNKGPNSSNHQERIRSRRGRRVEELAERLQSVGVGSTETGSRAGSSRQMHQSCESDPDIDILSYESFADFESN